MNENQDQPAENLPGEQQPVSQPVTSPVIELKDMEVHHHGHVHEQKKWKEYVFQFIMLFLAVFLGFLAENLREKEAEKNVEHEYIESLVTDLKADRSLIQLISPLVMAQAHGIDSLQILFSQPDLKNDPASVYKCYYYSTYLQLSYPINFNQRTITQLLSSGNMRLLKTKGAADSVTGYSNLVKGVDVQKQMYVDYVNKCTESMFNVFNISYLRRVFNSKDDLVFAQDNWSNIQLLTTDPLAINKLMATLEVTKLMMVGYKQYLDIVDQQAEKLIAFLKAEYRLKS